MGFSLFKGQEIEVPDFARVQGKGRKPSPATIAIREAAEEMEIGDTLDIRTDSKGIGFKSGPDGKIAANAFRSSVGTMLKKTLGPSGVFFTPRVAGFENNEFMRVPKTDDNGDDRFDKNGKPMMQKSFYIIRLERVTTPITKERKVSAPADDGPGLLPLSDETEDDTDNDGE